MIHPGPFPPEMLPAGVRPRLISNVNGMTVHILQSRHKVPDRPCVLLLHGFSELAWSWRDVMGTLSRSGNHLVAPDPRRAVRGRVRRSLGTGSPVRIFYARIPTAEE